MSDFLKFGSLMKDSGFKIQLEKIRIILIISINQVYAQVSLIIDDN